jgi:hypothetical protein
MKTNFYTYILKRPDGTPFYVGKGSGKRCFRHFNHWNIKNDTNKLKVNIINKIRRSGGEPIIEILQENISENDAFKLEMEQIKLYGRIHDGGLLSNMSDGGEGQSGYHHTKEVKEYFSKMYSGIGNPFFGKTHSEKSLVEIGNTNRGKILDSNWRNKISISSKNRPKSEEHKLKIQQAHKQRRKSPEEIQKLTELNKSRKGIPLSEDHKLKLSIATKGILKGPMSEDTKHKIKQTKLKNMELKNKET